MDLPSAPGGVLSSYGQHCSLYFLISLVRHLVVTFGLVCQPFHTLALVALQPFVSRLSTDAIGPAELRESNTSTKSSFDKRHSFRYHTCLFPGHAIPLFYQVDILILIQNVLPICPNGCYLSVRSIHPGRGDRNVGCFWAALQPKNTLIWRECSDNEHQLLIATLPHLRANAIENVSNTLNHAYLFPNHFVFKQTVR